MNSSKINCQACKRNSAAGTVRVTVKGGFDSFAVCMSCKMQGRAVR